MSDKYGDKVEGIKPPKIEQNVEPAKVETPQPRKEAPVTEKARQQIEPSRPNSNFSKTLEEAKPKREVKLGDRVKMEMTNYVLSMKEATNADETAKAQMKFYNVIRSILMQKDYATFSKEWTSLLNFINNNRDDITYLSISRAVYKWPLDARQQKTFGVLALLAVVTANPKERRSPAGVSPDDVIENANRLGREAAYNLGAYYNFQ